jgi:hypothetical protein
MFKQKLFFCWHLEGQGRKKQDPDPLVRGMDPRIRIHSKMSWIRNTGVPQAPEKEDPSARRFLRCTDSAGPVSPTCFDV